MRERENRLKDRAEVGNLRIQTKIFLPRAPGASAIDLELKRTTREGRVSSFGCNAPCIQQQIPFKYHPMAGKMMRYCTLRYGTMSLPRIPERDEDTCGYF